MKYWNSEFKKLAKQKFFFVDVRFDRLNFLFFTTT